MLKLGHLEAIHFPTEFFFMFTWMRGEGVGKSLLRSWPPECCPFVYL